jgi:hypothetical protein
MKTIFEIMEWKSDCKYRVTGVRQEKDGEAVIMFDLSEPEIFIFPEMLDDEMDEQSRAVNETGTEGSRPLIMAGKRIKAIPESWAKTFGSDYYLHEHDGIPSEIWEAHSNGEVYPTDNPPLVVTEPAQLKSYITKEINSADKKEEK